MLTSTYWMQTSYGSCIAAILFAMLCISQAGCIDGDDEMSNPGGTGGTGGRIFIDRDNVNMAGTAVIDPPPLSCDAFRACGGDYSGQWQVVDGCTEMLEMAEMMIDDESMCGITSSTSFFGTASFGQGTADSLDVTIENTTIFPAACFNSALVSPQLCNTLEAEIQRNLPDDQLTLTCQPQSAVCRCDLRGNVMRVGSTNITPEDYCVQGDQLLIKADDAVLLFER